MWVATSGLMILGKGTLELQSIDLNPAVVTAINDYLLVKASKDLGELLD